MNQNIHYIADQWRMHQDRGTPVTLAELCQDNQDLILKVQDELHKRSGIETAKFNHTEMHEKVTADYQADEAELDETPPSIPNYQIERMLGKGGMGRVYLATDLLLHRQVAIKVCNRHFSKAARARFQTEATSLARLQHPHIVQIYGSGVTSEGESYFVMECTASGTLSDCVGKERVVPDEVARLILLLARAMGVAHQKGIIHRDLKPSNILMAPLAEESTLNCLWGVPKIADFGLAKLIDENQKEQNVTQSGQILGPPCFMAPEQARSGKIIGPPTDVYSLGAILYQLLAGRPPYVGATSIDLILRMLESEPDSLLQLRPDLPGDLVAICEKCMAKDPAERFATMRELSDALEEYLANGKVIHASLKVSKSNTVQQKHHPITAVIASVLDVFFNFLSLIFPAAGKALRVSTWPFPVRMIARLIILVVMLWGFWELGKYVDIRSRLYNFPSWLADGYLSIMFLTIYVLNWLIYWLLVELRKGMGFASSPKRGTVYLYQTINLAVILTVMFAVYFLAWKLK